MAELNREIVRDQLQELAGVVADSTPPGWGFAVMLFDFEEGKDGSRNFQWVSNAERKSMAGVLREYADRLEQREAGELGIDSSESHL